MVGKIGYYTRNTGDGDVYHFFMGDEPPDKQSSCATGFGSR
jgi:hypothetical protein